MRVTVRGNIVFNIGPEKYKPADGSLNHIQSKQHSILARAIIVKSFQHIYSKILTARMVTRLKRLAGIAGRIAVLLCKKLANRLFLRVSSVRLRARPQIWVSRADMVMPEVHDFICAAYGCRCGWLCLLRLTLPSAHLYCGCTISTVPGHVCDCPCLEAC